MNRGLLWLALADLCQAWLRSGLAALAIAAAILAVAFFSGQIQLRQGEVVAGYEAAGAATFVLQLTGVADDEIDGLAGSVRTLGDVTSVEAPYSGISTDVVVDTSFLVFRNEQQQEHLGARTSVLGVDRNFDLATTTSTSMRSTRSRLRSCWVCRSSLPQGRRGRRIRKRFLSLPVSPTMSACSRVQRQLSSSSIAARESRSHSVSTASG